MNESYENKSSQTPYILVFTLDDLLFALRTSSVERTIRMVEITPLPKAPEIVLGIINVQGLIVPVVNIRNRFQLPDKESGLTDSIIIVSTGVRKLGIVVDTVKDVIELDESKIVSPPDIINGIEHVEGILKLEDGMVLIHDINKFLSLEEGYAIDKAIVNSE
ncbi:MAG: purine-binding chemotaxis protein CheW [Nitrospirae bacterium]|nr:purine-binding chemotaxis protein CheW [Nitrospirota bacterium]